MCGIAGLFRPGGLLRGDRAALGAMNATLRHRGPDAEGLWFDEAAGVGLAQQRLAIQDLSPAGAQPMVSHSGRYAITFNGEIYNFKELRGNLQAQGVAPNWRGHSDTEAALAAIDAFGLDHALRMLTGMFAFILFDKQSGAVIIGRDPFGEKPLHVAEVDGAFLFASEIKAFRAFPGWQGTVDRAALTAFLRHGYIPEPMSLYAGLWKVMPGEYCVFPPGSAKAPQRQRYWDSFAEASKARASRFAGSAAEAESELDRLIHASIRRQMVADVPVGAFLSGGIDSSTIAAVMQAESTRPIETFTIGFNEANFDESPYARDVARHLGTQHHEVILSASDASDLVTAMPDVYDEPFADPSQLPTYLVARFARTKVTVALSGDAGDELFAGYGRYHSLRRKWEKGLSGSLTRHASAAYARLLLNGAVRPAEALGLVRLAGHRIQPLKLRLEDMAARFEAPDAMSAYARSFTVTDQAHRLVLGGEVETDDLVARVGGEAGWSVLEQASLYDVHRYLPGDILVKVDRAAMAHGLETRVPLLDPDIARFAWSLPDEIRVLGGQRKGLLKAVLDRYVPRSLWDRPKRGFGIPAAEWLRGALRPLAETLFARDALTRGGYLDAEAVRAIWEDFCEGGQRRVNLVWTLFVLQLYLQRES